MKTRVRQFLMPTAALALFCASAQAADYPTTVSGFNPLGYWRLNETTASPPLNKVANSGSVADADGYFVLDTELGQTGANAIVGNAVRLNNAGSALGYCGSKIDVPFTPGLNPNPPFSVEFWAKPNSITSDSTGVSPLSDFNPNSFGGGNRSGWLFYVNNNGRWQFRLGLTSGYAGIVSASGGNATVGTWQHVVATWDGTTVLLYVNGVQVGSLAVSQASTGWKPNPQMALRIGGTPLTGSLSDANAISATGISGNRGWDGWMDEVALYGTLNVMLVS